MATRTVTIIHTGTVTPMIVDTAIPMTTATLTVIRTATPTGMTMTDLSALQSARLLQLCSANLPVGGFSFSQGLEQAVERGWVNSAAALEEWLTVLLNGSVAHADVPMLKLQYEAISNNAADDFENRDAWIAATRESEEILRKH